MVRDQFEQGLDAILDLLLGGHARGVNIVDTRANFVGIAILLERAQKFEVTLGCFNGDDVGIETLNRGEDVIEVRVAKVGVSLQGVGNTSSSKLERIHSPGEVVIPIDTTEG